MGFNLKNYDQDKIDFYMPNIFSLKEKIDYVLPSSNNVNFIQCLNFLKQNDSLSPNPNYKVTIQFENFSNLTSILFETKKVIHNVLTKIKLSNNPFLDKAWSDDFENTIHITKDVYKRDNSFTEFLGKSLSSNEVLNYIFLHELGHSIHSEIKKNSSLNFSSQNILSPNIQHFLNDSIPFTHKTFLTINSNNTLEQRKIEKDLNLATHNGMKEGFADLYASIAVSMIYPKNQAEKIIQNVIDGRDYNDLWNSEFYHSKQSVQTFLNDFQSGSPHFNNFNDIQNYIEKTIVNTIMTKLTNELNNKSDNDSFVNHYFGVLKNKLKPKNCESLNEMINYMNEKYNLKLNNRVENDFFKIGFQSSSQNSPNPQISIVTVQDRIAALKYKCLDFHTNITPPKI